MIDYTKMSAHEYGRAIALNLAACRTSRRYTSIAALRIAESPQASVELARTAYGYMLATGRSPLPQRLLISLVYRISFSYGFLK